MLGTWLIRSNLAGANLSSAFIDHCFFRNTALTGAFFGGATLIGCTFAHCSTLHEAIGLEEVVHRGPSSIDSFTLKSCIDKLPDVFLEGCGYTQYEISYLRALYRENPIAMYSCFISHAEADLSFASRLLADLRQSNVTCWHYKDSLRGGRDWQPQIDEAIKVHDKLILVCSRQSVYRENVVKEILRAIDIERQTGEQKLFPIRLDDHILSAGMMEEAREMVTTRVWRENWVIHIRRKHVPNFSGWDKDHAKYTAELSNLLRDLRQSV